jgi:hypothetical protein
MKQRKTKKRHLNAKSRRRRSRRGGWNLHNPFNRAPIPDEDAITIGKFLINHELPRYFSNDDTYYGANQHYKHPYESELQTLFKIRRFQKLFATDDDYKWLGMQFYFFTNNPNPIPGPNNNGYQTSDDGVFFFDWITNTPSRNNIGILQYHDQHPNPLNLPVKVSQRTRFVAPEIPEGIVARRTSQFKQIEKK